MLAKEELKKLNIYYYHPPSPVFTSMYTKFQSSTLETYDNILDLRYMQLYIHAHAHRMHAHIL